MRRTLCFTEEYGNNEPGNIQPCEIGPFSVSYCGRNYTPSNILFWNAQHPRLLFGWDRSRSLFMALAHFQRKWLRSWIIITIEKRQKYNLHGLGELFQGLSAILLVNHILVEK